MGRRRGDSLGWQWKEVYLVPANLDWLKDASLVGGGTIKCLSYSNGLAWSSILAWGQASLLSGFWFSTP